ncbi:MAG: GNAT family N-acetyltransferase, partial [Gemmatimonadetes bacterium]|nr:GNAT family N-acetyltransferase [Gemmatimonadota bacterium]
VKDYDAIPGTHPREWADHFDLSNWGFLAARLDGKRIGGAAIAYATEGLDMLGGRGDLAVLWDIRVAPEARGSGIGAALFGAAETWAAARGARQLKIETQNINVPACQFYARQGCVLGAIHRFAYPGLPDEVQLLWYKDLPWPSPKSQNRQG